MSIETIATSDHYTESHTITLFKQPGRRLDESGIKTNLETIIAGTFTAKIVARGWNASIVYRAVDSDSEWDTSRVKPLSESSTFYDYSYVPDSAHSGHFEYRATIAIELDTDKRRESVDVELLNIATTMHARGQYSKWNVEKLDGAPFTVKDPSRRDAEVRTVVVGGSQQSSADAIGYAPCVVPSNWDSHFKHLYGLDYQIAMVKSAIETAMASGWRKRFHTKLIGPPGCGKSAILSAMQQAVGEESVLKFDATATTAAGAMKMLDEVDELPRIMVVEELEKATTDTFQFLLGLMDDRSEIRKVTARKNIFRETKVLVFATINDESMLDRAMGGTERTPGALSSRFAQPAYFDRPSRDLLAKILLREIRDFGGDDRWIEPTLDLSDALGMTDPRRIIATCLLGRDDLLTGEYQKRLLAVGMPHHEDVEESVDSVRARLNRLVLQIQDGAV